MDVVAFVRNPQKFSRALFDQDELVTEDLIGGGNQNEKERSRSRGPRLQVVVGNVLSRRDLRRGDLTTDNSTSATAFANNEATEGTNDEHGVEWGSDETLRDAISGSTVLVSCLGTSRLSNLWEDYLRVPLIRVFRKDVSKWSSDPRHPYYTNYLSTKKILDEAEKEQKKRDALVQLNEAKERLLSFEGKKKRRREEKGFESEIAEGLRKKRRHKVNSVGHGTYYGNDDAVQLPKKGQLPSPTDRIKFIRISHLMVGRSPFRIWNVITNILWSQLSRFEVMGEMLMESSKNVDTIVLRPGHLTDEKRVSSHTWLQLSVDGRVPYPSLVGREDVADITVVLALTKTCQNETESSTGGPATTSRSSSQSKHSQSSHHYAWAVRWAGQHLSPPQGRRPDGLPSAALCFNKAIKEQIKFDTNRRQKEKRMMKYQGGRELMTLERWKKKMKPFVFSLAVSIPLLTMGMLSWRMLMKIILLISKSKAAQHITSLMSFPSLPK